MEYIYKATHPEQPEMFAAVVLASKPTDGGKPLITLHLRYPRIIHGEIMTHRVFSRNARSSRAVPVKTMLNEVRTKPFVPWHWGLNQKGMQAGEECNAPVSTITIPLELDVDAICRKEAWFCACDVAAGTAEAYMNAGYHKQIPNRLLEPFSWIDTLITSSSWANFFHLRDHKDAEPHFQDLARLVKEALTWVRDNDELQILESGQWHLPYVTLADREEVRKQVGSAAGSNQAFLSLLQKISAARCARISYTPFDGNPSIERELERFDFLINSDRLHASPTEHQATPDRFYTGQELGQFPPEPGWEAPHLHGNLEGWIQFRKTLAGEYYDEDEAFWSAAA